jgi:intracellular septation protein
MNPQVRRLALDFGPLIIFWAVFFASGKNIFVATAVLIPTVLAALAIGYGLEKKLSPMPIFTAIVVVILGGLTLYLKNDAFIKMKPTVVYGFFSAILLGGLCFNSLYIKYALAIAFELNEEGWRKLTVRWGLFFLGLAVLNEAVWRSFSTEVWVYAKIGMFGLTFLFAAAQVPLLMKHQIPHAGDGTDTQE